MKKLFLIALISILFSCGYAPIDNSRYIIITEISRFDEKYSNYYGVGNSDMVFTPSGIYFKFRDTTGKFQIGDTINFVKQ
jgi:hypothetical protein